MPKTEIQEARPELPEAFRARIEEMKKQAEKRVFFSFDKDDAAVVELLDRKVIPTENGDSPCWTARYLSGNIHGVREGSPDKKMQVFRFWERQVLGNKLQEHNVRKGDTVCIVGLGIPEGKRYHDYLVEVVSFQGEEEVPKLQD